MNKVPSSSQPLNNSPDIEILPMDDTPSYEEGYKPPQRVFKVNFNFANDPKVQGRKRKKASPPPPKVQTQITDFKTASGRNVEKGQVKSVYDLQSSSSSSRAYEGFSSSQENGGGGPRYLGGTRYIFVKYKFF